MKQKYTIISWYRRGFSFFICITLLSLSSLVYSQNVAINETLAPANPDAGLDVDFISSGFLLPRILLTGTASFAPLSAHLPGMLIYNTAATNDVTPGLYINDGTQWNSVVMKGSAAGDMQYWNGTQWDVVTGGIAGQHLSVGTGGSPQWSGNSSGYPTLATTFPVDITSGTATGGGNITNDGGNAVLARGVCWDVSPEPTIALPTTTVDGSGTGSFSSAITGLTGSTTYYIRAYATSSLGTVYGNQLTFKTN